MCVMAQYGLVKMKDKLDNSMMGHSCGQKAKLRILGDPPPLFFFGEVAIQSAAC